MVRKDEKDKINTNVVLNKLDYYEDGDYVGYVEVKIGDEVVGKENVYIRKSEEIKEEVKKSFIEKLIDFLKFWE